MIYNDSNLDPNIEDDKAENADITPFDPQKIRLRTQPFSLAQCLTRIKQGTLLLSPDFQRSFIWDRKRQSQLIESLMLKIPLPMFYVWSDEKENYHVVDGLQRFTTLRNFILDKKDIPTDKSSQTSDINFALEGLEFWQEFNGKKYKDLDVYLQNRILETTLQVTIIEYQTPEKVKRNVFKRLNTGGMPLTPQEIRNALYQGESTLLLKDLVQMPIFRKVIHSNQDNRMAGREIILRFLAFSIPEKDEYTSGDMDDFLSKTMEKINNLYTPQMISELKSKFATSMDRAYKLFKDYAFRKSLPGQKKTPINKSLFEVWSVFLSDLPAEKFDSLLKNRELLYKNLSSAYANESFQRAVSRDSWKVESVKKRYNIISMIIDRTSKGEIYGD